MQAQHQHLAFRIAEADIVFDELRTLRRDHQPGEQHALDTACRVAFMARDASAG